MLHASGVQFGGRTEVLRHHPSRVSDKLEDEPFGLCPLLLGSSTDAGSGWSDENQNNKSSKTVEKQRDFFGCSPTRIAPFELSQKHSQWSYKYNYAFLR